jgi:thiol peroxidase
MADSVTLKGNPVALNGTVPDAGQSAPDFTLTANDLSSVSLSDSSGKIRLISVVPSIDTPTCSIETKRFNHELDNTSDNVVAYTVSVDTPFAQKRWCGAEGVDKMQLLSDYKGAIFARAYGLYIENPLGAAARCVFIIDGDGKIVYRQLVPEIANEPDYQEVLSKLQELAG